MDLTEKQIEDHKAWLQDQKPAHQAYVGVLITDKLTAAANGPGEALSNAPERIYLQDGIDKDYAEDGIVPADVYKGNEDMTWCKDRINDNDTEYVRADLSTPQPGMVTVPREPTKDMLEEGFDAINKQYARDPLDDALERTQAVYRAMLDAAKPSTTDTKHR